MAILNKADFEKLDGALDEESWLWLSDNRPDIADGVEQAVNTGAMAGDVRRRVMRRCNREELADRCFQAARHLWSQKQ